MGEKAIQKIGLAAPSNDANTGDIEQPWNSFVHMRDGLKDIQAQVRTYCKLVYFGHLGAQAGWVGGTFALSMRLSTRTPLRAVGLDKVYTEYCIGIYSCCLAVAVTRKERTTLSGSSGGVGGFTADQRINDDILLCKIFGLAAVGHSVQR